MIAKFTAMLKNKDIRKRILYTLLVLFIFRFGSAITVPGVNVSDLVQGIGDNTLFAMISLLEVEDLNSSLSSHLVLRHILLHQLLFSFFQWMSFRL